MASCATCGKTILFGGARAGPLRFCNSRCKKAGGAAAELVESIPEDVIEEEVAAIHAGDCPR